VSFENLKKQTKTFVDMLEENSQCCKGFPTECCDCKEKCALEEYVSVDALKQWLQEEAKIMCYQCEKCGFIDANTHEEFQAMPKEHQQFLLKHRANCGGRFLPVKYVLLKEVLGLLEKKEGEGKCEG